MQSTKTTDICQTQFLIPDNLLVYKSSIIENKHPHLSAINEPAVFMLNNNKVAYWLTYGPPGRTCIFLNGLFNIFFCWFLYSIQFERIKCNFFKMHCSFSLSVPDVFNRISLNTFVIFNDKVCKKWRWLERRKKLKTLLRGIGRVKNY